jgi:DNA-binding CsgD family transcriptional regulator
MATRTRADINNQKHSVATATIPSLTNAGIKDLIRAVITFAAESTDSRPFDDRASERIIIDTEVDGHRYLLARMPTPVPHEPLSPREVEIVRMVAQGHSNKLIADVLSISGWTVSTHVRRIFAKLGVGSRAAMVARLVERGALNQQAPRGDHPNDRESRATSKSVDENVGGRRQDGPLELHTASSKPDNSRMMRRAPV